MSQLILDDQLDVHDVLGKVRQWTTAQLLREVRPNEHVLDERVPVILQTLNRPTFITIDKDFWDQDLCHPSYAILYFAFRDDEQFLLPRTLRALFRQPDFRTRARRMGKVARVSSSIVSWWQFQETGLQRFEWNREP